jgi:hypothetical protein
VDARIEALQKQLRWRRAGDTPEQVEEQLALRSRIRELERL